MAAEQANPFVYPQKVLEDDRLRLEPIHDVNSFAELLQPLLDMTPEVYRYTAAPHDNYPSPAAFANDFLAPILADSTKALYMMIVKNDSSFTIGDQTYSGEPVGALGYLNTDPSHLATEIGHVTVVPAWQRTFVSTHAIGLMLQYALESPSDGGLGLRRVAWQCHNENAASKRAAERMGFVFEGILRWARVLPAGKEDNGRKAPVEGQNPGRDSAVLSMTWEDWFIDGKKQHVESLMKRP